jgi:hypothetical protein
MQSENLTASCCAWAKLGRPPELLPDLPEDPHAVTAIPMTNATSKIDAR